MNRARLSLFAVGIALSAPSLTAAQPAQPTVARIASDAPAPSTGHELSDPAHDDPAHVRLAEPPPASEERVTVDVVPEDDAEVVLHVVREPAHAAAFGGARSSVGNGMTFAELCAAPCEARIPPGRYRFAVSSGVQAPQPFAEHTLVDRDAHLRIGYESFEGTRMGGLALFLGGLVAGLAITMVPALTWEARPDTSDGLLLVGVGASTALVSIITGVILMTQSDRPRLSVDF